MYLDNFLRLFLVMNWFRYSNNELEHDVIKVDSYISGYYTANLFLIHEKALYHAIYDEHNDVGIFSN
ncbi:hypothetical protein SH1V18_45420 [Vallitalea longa]|uniref:Uncharacterized protein n=2 Tax=Vallitalea longa TaxID=2936439 RepID=A0A9W5YDQ2_9FIRM|nr:hypothetical protein SH1V18_45420 [Vallitalea longa]